MISPFQDGGERLSRPPSHALPVDKWPYTTFQRDGHRFHDFIRSVARSLRPFPSEIYLCLSTALQTKLLPDIQPKSLGRDLILCHSVICRYEKTSPFTCRQCWPTTLSRASQMTTCFPTSLHCPCSQTVGRNWPISRPEHQSPQSRHSRCQLGLGHFPSLSTPLPSLPQES